MTIDHVAPWVETESGIAFDLLAPRAEDVSLVDIAGHLSKINRYAGATVGPNGYTVAQHSVHVSRILEVWGCPLAIQREGLLHDAAEAYYGDVSSPVQRAIAQLYEWAAQDAIPEGPARDAFLGRSPLRALKSIVDPVVRGALGLPLEETPIVKRADLVALACERRAIMAPCSRDWNLPEYPDTRWATIHVHDAAMARQTFTQRLEALDRAILDASQKDATP